MPGILQLQKRACIGNTRSRYLLGCFLSMVTTTTISAPPLQVDYFNWKSHHHDLPPPYTIESKYAIVYWPVVFCGQMSVITAMFHAVE